MQLYTKPKRVVNLQVGKAACAVQMVDTRQRGAEVMACLYCQTPRQRPIKIACKNCVEVFIQLRDRCKFPLGSVHNLSVSVSGSLNEPKVSSESAN